VDGVIVYDSQKSLREFGENTAIRMRQDQERGRESDRHTEADGEVVQSLRIARYERKISRRHSSSHQNVVEIVRLAVQIEVRMVETFARESDAWMTELAETESALNVGWRCIVWYYILQDLLNLLTLEPSTKIQF
jgi:hypothetical protein